MPSSAHYRPPQYAAAVAVYDFPSVQELCDYAHITLDTFEAARRLAEDRGDELIVLGTGFDDEGPMGDVRIVVSVHPGGGASLGMAPKAADADTYLDACHRLMRIRVEQIELMFLDVMVGVIKCEETVTLQ